MRVVLFFLCLVVFTYSNATQIVEWNKRPISVVLPVGKERVIQLPDNVIVGVPGSIKPLLRVQSAQGYVYLTARENFKESRIQLKMHKTGEIILLDVSTSNEETTQEDIIVKFPLPAGEREEVKASSANVRNSATPIELTRFAARSFYAPERLAISDKRIRMTKAPNIDLTGLFTGNSYDAFDAKALAVFRTGKLYLTAIKLVNKTPIKQVIEFSDIDADFMYATPQHVRINEMNVPGDTTMLYLITNKPLSAALYQPMVMNRLRGK